MALVPCVLSVHISGEGDDDILNQVVGIKKKCVVKCAGGGGGEVSFVTTRNGSSLTNICLDSPSPSFDSNLGVRGILQVGHLHVRAGLLGYYGCLVSDVVSACPQNYAWSRVVRPKYVLQILP
jgi:hypothetical protein